eukprot:CAMPEP_0113541720 /NCGR_PEP_ID=MMETSP0015_2-20120614/9196_1 /TAXON_ID=2838 /ORGANISM="Odontella" /LENGTH=1950 /DNA_ID=CAMNT_0000441673 /DNA_START=244 /DNA_END=6096 /DNA_ORIENTATION=+ /assembly_acc=CAM_ASM_000160
MAAVQSACGRATLVPAAKPSSTHDPAEESAAPTPILREWSYRPATHPQPQATTRSSSLPPYRPGPVERSRTPVAFAVKAEAATPQDDVDANAVAAAAMGGSRHPWLNAAAASAAAATAATLSAGQIYQQTSGVEVQPQPVVATLVTNLACGLRSGLGNLNLVYAGVAERIEDGGESSKHQVQVLDPSTHEMLSLPPPPSALPDLHGLASIDRSGKASPERRQPQQQQQQPHLQPQPQPQQMPICTKQPCTSTPDEPRSDIRLVSSAALEPPSIDEDRSSQATGLDTVDDSLRDWVLDEFDEATFHVENGKLVEVRAPVPSIEYEEMYEEALERQMERRGIGCVRRPRGMLPPLRRRSFADFGRKEENDGEGASSLPPLDHSAPERKIACKDDEGDDQPERTSGKNGSSKARHPVLRWVQRRKEARQHRRERKITEHQESQQQQRQDQNQEQQSQSTTIATNAGSFLLDEEDRGYDASSSERSARVHTAKTNITGHPHRSRSVPGLRRLPKSKSPKSSDDKNFADGGTGRSKSKSPKRPKSFKNNLSKKAKKRRNRASRRRAVSLEDVVSADRDGSEGNGTGEDGIEADYFGRLKPLPTHPWSKLRASQTGAAETRARPAAPITHVIRRTCASVTNDAAAVSCGSVPRGQPAPFSHQPHPVLAFAATATERMIKNLSLQQQGDQLHPKQMIEAPPDLLPLAKLLPAVPIPSLPATALEDVKNVAEAPPHVPPADAFHILPPLPSAEEVPCSSEDNYREATSSEDKDEDENITTEMQGRGTDVLPPPPQKVSSHGKVAEREDVVSDVDSLLEDITRVLDELEAYPGVEEVKCDEDGGIGDDETTPSLAGTDASSSQESLTPPLASTPEQLQSFRRRVEMFESLCDTGILSAPPKPLREFNRGRSWTAPSAISAPAMPIPGEVPEECKAPDQVAVREKSIVVPPARAPPPSPLKVVFVGDSVGSIPGAADVARQLDSRQRRLRRYSSEKKVKTPAFEVWNGPGAGGNTVSFGHHATQSLFFVSNALYVLVWDMALDDPKTYPRGRRRARSGSDHSDDDEDDRFAAEEAGRRADRALERRVDEDVSAWVDHLLLSLEGRGGGSTCSILPVAIVPDGSDTDEVRRRRDLLRSRLLRRCEEHVQHRSRGCAKTPSPTPDLVFAGERQSVLCVDSIDSAEMLGAAIESFAERRRKVTNDVPCKLFATPDMSFAVASIVQELKQEHEVVTVGRIVSLLRKKFEFDDTNATRIVVEILCSLSEEGDIIYFGDSLRVASAPAVEVDGGYEAHRHFVVLRPKWLSSAISCIIRPDLKREILETRRLMNAQGNFDKSFGVQDDTPFSNSPVITSDDARLLWQSMSFMREACESNASGSSTLHHPSLFEYLEQVLVQSGVFLPLRARGHFHNDDELPKCSSQNSSTLYLLPGLLAPDPPSDIWTYKAKESWSTTLCHSWLFRGSVPLGTMELVTGAVLQDLLQQCEIQHRQDYQKESGVNTPIKVHHVTVWRSAFILRLGTEIICPETSERTESIIDLFGHLTGTDASPSGPPCVAAESMGINMKRLTLSAKGQAGDAGRKIWDGGLSLVTRSITRALGDVRSDIIPVEKEIVCPECLSFLHPCEASTLKADWVKSFAEKGQCHVRCGRGHNVDISLVCGSCPKSNAPPIPPETKVPNPPVMPVSTLLSGVVVVGLWDGKAKQIRNVGSGFVADKEKGLIATASHILFEMQSRDRFGQEFFGLKDAKVVIGVIPKSGSSKGSRKTTAVFRYFAEIVTHDVFNVDACILRITTKFEEDVSGDGEGCGDQPEMPLKNNMRAMKAEKLHQLKLTKKFELEEDVRILGYNQGGEGRLKPGLHVNRCADFARGYVCKKFKIPAGERGSTGLSVGFNPMEETVVMCPTISGHSGGPCVNQEGAVIGILSRADPADRQRCYLVPASEVKKLLKKAKAKCTMSPLDLYYRT